MVSPGLRMTPRGLSELSAARIRLFGIPVDNLNPYRYWIIGLAWESRKPVVAELQQLQTYQQYKIESVYNLEWQIKLKAMPLPAVCRHNTIMFHKHAPNQWQYCRGIWQDKTLIPRPDRISFGEPTRTLPCLEKLMDEIESNKKEWLEWKARYARLFRQTKQVSSSPATSLVAHTTP